MVNTSFPALFSIFGASRIFGLWVSHLGLSRIDVGIAVSERPGLTKA